MLFEMPLGIAIPSATPEERYKWISQSHEEIRFWYQILSFYTLEQNLTPYSLVEFTALLGFQHNTLKESLLISINHVSFAKS